MGQYTDGKVPRRVLVLGASGIIGSSCARRLAARGHHITVHGGHDQGRLDAVATSCREAGAAGVSSFLLDLGDLNTVFESPVLPRDVDILVHAWGPWLHSGLETTSPDDWEWLTRTNLALPGALVSTFGPLMAERRWGRIVLFGAATSDRIQSYRTIAAWAAAKTALGVVAKSAAREWGERGVTCNVVCPGYVSLGAQGGTGMPALPAGRTFQEPEELATVVDFLCDEGNSPMNGAILSCGKGL